jgi:hypothetical protein
MKEQWLPISGYENSYEISSIGRVKSVAKYYGRCYKQFKPESILNTKDNGRGYIQVELSKKGKPKIFYIHRLVALAFIPNPQNLSEVNHIDGDKTNNAIHNLEWASRLTNEKHAWQTGLKKKGSNAKGVLQFDMQDKLIKEWPAASIAADQLSLTYYNIARCCRGEIKQHSGYKWKFKN